MSRPLIGVTTSEVRLAANPMWSGPTPAFPEIVVRNLDARRQLAAIGSGSADLVLDLSPSQADAATGRPQRSSLIRGPNGSSGCPIRAP